MEKGIICKDTDVDIMDVCAVILCAGRGTRMNDDSRNKVCFECAGVPVIRRIIDNMRDGGVTHFVVVAGHKAQSVMDSLDGVEGVVYAYQREQKGTGHAALCGINALRGMGCKGRVIVSMGDKIVSPGVIKRLLEKDDGTDTVWGVQPVEANYGGGRVVLFDGKPCGVVELADAALMTLAGVPGNERAGLLDGIGLNEKKARAVLKKASEREPDGTKCLCGHRFTADEILATPYANAGLYCFDIDCVARALASCDSSNAQGEIYLTDTLEYFAKNASVRLLEVKDADDMLTYSTKPELCSMSRHFMRTASQLILDIENGRLRPRFEQLYGENAALREKRYIALLEYFIGKYGDKRVVLTRAPGRVNLMGRHIDHRGGSINVMTVDNDTVCVFSPRDDDVVNITNIDSSYPDDSFSINECLSLGSKESWLEYLTSEGVVASLERSRGSWCNYVKSAFLRLAFESNAPFRGADMAACGTIPVAAGLSSSSSIVVACAEAAASLNCMNLTDREFIDLCGEGEWFVGSRGGAGDHAAMRCSKRGRITHLGFKPFYVGESAECSEKYAIIVADSATQAKKSEGSKDKFNAKVAAYEFAFMLINRLYPDRGFAEFRDIAAVCPVTDIYGMLLALPQTVTRDEITRLLPSNAERLARIFANHTDPGEYELRSVALYGLSECARADMCIETLKNGQYELLGQLMKISHNGDRASDIRITDELLRELISNEAPLYLQSGAYGCSTARIDEMCDILNACDGVMGSELVGAGLGGCVIALVERDKANAAIERLNGEYYDKYSCPYAAGVYMPSSGSAVIY